MVLCPPHSEQTSGVDLDPFPDLGPGPADPFPDLQPSQDGPAPLPNPGIGTAARAEVSTRLTWPRPVVKRMRVVMVAALTVVAVASGATGPYPWSPGGPGGHPRARITRSAEWGALLSPKNVITQARARQRRRWRRIIIASGAIGAGAGWAAGHSGSPPRRRQGSRSHLGGTPAPAPWAERLPGLAALARGQDASIRGLSCPSAGNCAIDGSYGFLRRNMTYHSRVFVASEVHGRWRKVQDVPGLSALGAHNDADIGPVSCPSAGNCLAVGYYGLTVGPYGDSGHVTGFLAMEQDGTWHNAQPIPGLRARLPAGSSIVLSCPSAGNCAFGGAYTDRAHHGFEAFVDSQANGKWTKAQPIPGLARLETGAHSSITAISCASPGNCTAGGSYGRQDHHLQGFVVSETNGVWGTAKPIGGTPTHRNSLIAAISCASAGNCGLTGDNYNGAIFGSTPFVASQVSGTWSDTQPVPGLAILDQGSGALAPTLSCPAPGECTASGYYTRADPQPGARGALKYCAPAGGAGCVYAFTVTLAGGTWHTAQQLPGITALNSAGSATIGTTGCYSPSPYPYGIDYSALRSCTALSCTSVGNCSAGGSVTTSTHTEQAFTVTQTGGTWHTAQQVRGLAALGTASSASVEYVSCPPAGPCVSAGSYRLGSNKSQNKNQQLFVVG